MALLAFAAALLAAAPAAADTPRARVLYQDGHTGRLLVAGIWHFRLDPSDSGVRRNFQGDGSSSGWTPVETPHGWNSADIVSDAGSIGWYRKDFEVPRALRGRSFKLRFESVNHHASIWLNGRLIGRHTGGYVPFEVEASNLRSGSNRLAVRVDSRREPDDLSHWRFRGRIQDAGWWNFGGILREVYLRPIDRIDIADLTVRPVLPCPECEATVEFEALLENLGVRAQRAGLSLRFGEETLRLGAVRVGGRSTRKVRARMRVASPRLWSPESPNLYPASATATVAGRAVARYAIRTGIRSLAVNREGIALLNGRPMQLRGASFHEDDPTAGAGWTAVQRRQTLQLLEGLGATATRSHYPLHPAMLELFDRAGILVWEQTPLYQLPNETLVNPAVRERAVEYSRQMVRKDKNHPSVFVWSVANELDPIIDVGQERYIDRATRAIRALDRTRLVAIDRRALLGRAEGFEVLRRLDAIGINEYYGWYNNRTSELGDFLDRHRASYPRQAHFVTEYGAEANRSGPADEKGTFEFQQSYLQEHLAIHASKPYINGSIVWVLKDFRVHPGWAGGNPNPSPPINKKGLVHENGVLKPAYGDLQRLFQATPSTR